MSAQQQTRGVSPAVLDSIEDFIRTHEDPAVTVAEVAEGVDGIDHEQAKYRLQKLVNEGRVQKKKIGASAVMWYQKG